MPITRSDDPHDRLTHLAAVGVAAMEASPHNGTDVSFIILLSTPEDGGGMVMHNYEEEMDAAADLIAHLTVLFQVNGKTLQIHSVGGEQ